MVPGKILVLGGAGELGRRTLDQLLGTVPASRLVTISRRASDARLKPYIDKGVTVHLADLFDYKSLLPAFEGVEKILLIGAHAFTDRETQHLNVVAAAKHAGAKHLIYIAIQRREGSGRTLMGVTESDIFTEKAIKFSGMEYTILQHPSYLESYQTYFGEKALKYGVCVPSGSGRSAPATRDDLAAANAAVLTGGGHEGKVYKLSSNEAVSWSEIAEILSTLKGDEVPYEDVSEDEYCAWQQASGVPEMITQFFLSWVQEINAGEMEDNTGDLERLIGRKPTGVREFLLAHYPIVTQQMQDLRASQR
ncbi:hypothetical protein ACHAPX_004823 [Trichoderma viride]|jgi:NAD(P)H dehydrogenase (quinone)